MLLPMIGPEGQERLRAGRALIVGCGALGCAIADLIVRAGVGHVTLIDRDLVELTNLQRQTLYAESDVRDGLPKAEAARRRLESINSGVRLRAVIADFTPSNAGAIAGEALGTGGVLLDGTDNFETRYLLNDLAVSRGDPYIYGGAVGTRGMAMTVAPGRTPCLRCIFEEPPPPGSTPTCDTAGVLGPIVALVGAVQAAEGIKALLGVFDPPALSEFDAWTGEHRRIALGAARADCPCCGGRRFEFLDHQRSSATTSLCGQDAVQVAPSSAGSKLDLSALTAKLAPHGQFTALGALLVRGTLAAERSDSGQPLHLTVFADGRAIVKGTTRPEQARSIYARYIGG
jgi:adenylyltransferase/sulfurtransferase